MKSHRSLLTAVWTLLFAGVVGAIAQPSGTVATAPVYVPDYSHSGEPLPDGVLAWDALSKTVDATNEQASAYFTFSFTNVASANAIRLATNVVAVTNPAGPGSVTILSVHPSCGCTTAQLPPVPWIIPAGTGGEIKLTVNLSGKSSNPGTLFKQVTVTTDRGTKNLMLRINILPAPPMPEMTEDQRLAGMVAAKADRQAVFKGDCATCHLKKVEGKYGQQLFEAVCAICHQAKERATFVPDLHNLTVPTSEEFWRTWITAGKAGSLMPAFATSQGGPLNDLQIASLAAYLNAINPSHATNAPTK